MKTESTGRRFVDLSTPEGREAWGKAWPRARIHEPGPPKTNYIDLGINANEQSSYDERQRKCREFRLDPDWWKVYV
jgi:hypothetical protein